jgi:hypothetical protein
MKSTATAPPSAQSPMNMFAHEIKRAIGQTELRSRFKRKRSLHFGNTHRRIAHASCTTTPAHRIFGREAKLDHARVCSMLNEHTKTNMENN